VFLVYLAYTIRYFSLHDGRQRSPRHYSNLSESPLFLFLWLYSHLKNAMENLNYVFFLAICKEGARNTFLLPADMHYASVACRNCAGEIECGASWMLYLRPCSVQDNMCFILRHWTQEKSIPPVRIWRTWKVPFATFYSVT
jgi:hypothetical protein